MQYFHVVFTLPANLNPLALRNKRKLYAILFKAATETLLDLGRDPKFLGAQLGITAILHTWGQNLMDHPHLHCLVTGGGLSEDAQKWVSARKEFLFPVKVISSLFRGKFLAYLNESYEKGELRFPGTIKTIESPDNFNAFLSGLYNTDWVVYSKKPFSSPQKVLDYFGRYTHRVAISNGRIFNINDAKVTFSWRDYSDGNKKKERTLDAQEFIRRFLLHVLPKGFVKIRHYGIQSNRNRKTKLKICHSLLSIEIVMSYEEPEGLKSPNTHISNQRRKDPIPMGNR